MSLNLLKKYIKEVLSFTRGTNRSETLFNQNLHVTRRNSNVLIDEKEDSQETLQDMKRATCVLIFNDKKQILAVSRKDDPTDFGLPGGKVDPGESIEDAAIRELKEETGLSVDKLRKVFENYDSTGYLTTTFMCIASGEINTPESGVVKWVSKEELFNGSFGEYNKKLFNFLFQK